MPDSKRPKSTIIVLSDGTQYGTQVRLNHEDITEDVLSVTFDHYAGDYPVVTLRFHASATVQAKDVQVKDEL